MIYLTEGNIPLNATYDDDIVQEANSIYQLTFKFPTNNILWQRLREETFLTADDLHGEQDFVIFEVEKKHGYIQVYANQVMTMLNHYVVNPISLNRETGSTALSHFAGSITRSNPFSFFSDIEDRHTFNIDSKTAMEALTKDKHSIVGLWGGDLVRHGYQVRLLKNGGSENESLFMYKKNLSSYEHKTSTKSLRTRITFITTIRGEGENPVDKHYKVVVDSPLINKYSQIYEDVVEVNDQDVKDEASLREYGKQYFRTTLCDMLEDSIEIDVIGQSDVPVQMFDVVGVFHEFYGLDVRKKITKYTYSPMAKKLKSIGFGEFKSGLASAIGNVVSDAVKEETHAFETRLKKEIENSDLAFDRKVKDIKDELTDGIEQAKAKAEENKRALSDEIDNRFSNFDSSMNEKLEDQRTKIEEIRAIGSTVTQTAEEALEEARNALESANTSKGLSDSNFAKIEQITDRIRTLVTKQEVDPLTERLRIAENRIEVQADQIIEKLSRTDFDRLANDRGFQTATQVQNTVKHSVDGFQRNISRIETKLRDIIRNDNLLQNSSIIPVGDSLNGSWGLYLSGGNGRTDVIELRDAPHTAIKKGMRVVNNTNGGNKDIGQKINLVVGEKYTMSCWARVSATSTSQNVNLLMRAWTTNDNNRKLFKTISNKDWVRYQFTFTADTVSNSIQFGQSGSGSIEICGMKLEHSDRMTDYDVNSSEIVSVVEFNDVRDTVSSHTQTLQRQDQAISQVIQTADGLVSRVSNFLDDFNLVYDPTNFSKWTKKQPEANVIEVQADTRLLRITTTGKSQVAYHGFALPLNTSTFTKGEKLSYRMEVWVDVLPDAPLGIELWAEEGGGVIASDRVTLTKTGTQIITGTMTVQKSLTKSREFPLQIWLMKNGQVAIGQVSLIRGDKPPKKFSDNTSTQDVVTQTQVSQLHDSYAIQTLTGPGAVTSQINLNSNNILIEAAKIRLKGRTLLDEITAIDGYFKRLFVGDARVGTLNTDVIRSNSISAEKLIFDTALAKKLVSSDVFTDTLAAKTAFINKLRSVVVSATLLEGYKGRIGGFQIGTHDKDPSTYWLTGTNQFAVGMSNGNTQWGQTALWVNWGDNWGKAGDYAWFVKRTGEMFCYNKAQFWNTPKIHGNLEVAGNIYYVKDNYIAGFWVHSDIYTHFQEKNGYFYMHKQGGGYSWIPINKEISDRRYKTNIQDSQVSGLDVIENLKTYSYRKEYDDKVEDITCGIMAQDVQKYAPEAFFENPDGAYSYNTFALLPYLIKAIQELNQKVERLETI